jgi:hypothetical protein
MGEGTAAAGFQYVGHGDRSGWWTAWIAAMGDDRYLQQA